MGAAARASTWGADGAGSHARYCAPRCSVGTLGNELHEGECGLVGERAQASAFNPAGAFPLPPGNPTPGHPPARLHTTCLSWLLQEFCEGVANCSMMFWSQTMSLAHGPPPGAWH